MAYLMASQKAMLHEILKSNEFNPDDFEIVPSQAHGGRGEKGDAVRFKGTDYYFAIYPNQHTPLRIDKFFVEHSPGREEIFERQYLTDWRSVCTAFAGYLGSLEREITTSDPWENAEKFSNTINSLPETTEPNAPVSELERKAIWKALTGIQATLLGYAAESEEKQEFVKQQFKILRDAATKFGRKDYLMLLYTTIIGVATAIGVPSHLWVQLLQPLTQSVENLLKLLA
jgi:hypothetical protein